MTENYKAMVCTSIAKALGLGDVQVRKDLAKVSEAGRRRTGRSREQLIQDIERNGHDGIGKPEALKGDLSGWWSRRIDNTNRLV